MLARYFLSSASFSAVCLFLFFLLLGVITIFIWFIIPLQKQFHTKGHNLIVNVYIVRSTCLKLPRVPVVYIASSAADVIWQLLAFTPDDTSNKTLLLGRDLRVGRQSSYQRPASVWPENSWKLRRLMFANSMHDLGCRQMNVKSHEQSNHLDKQY